VLIRSVHLTKRAKADLLRVPEYIAEKLKLWIFLVETNGLELTRKIGGYHDEPLRGSRHNQRSIRLNRAYRAIYVIRSDGVIDFVSLEEVHKHEY
jgi:proteic killer suppression protein